MSDVIAEPLADRPSLTEFTNAFGEKLIYEVNREAFSGISARDRIQAQLGEALAGKNALHIILGSDSGQVLRHLIDLDRPSSSRYIVIELPHIKAWLEQEGLLEGLPEEVSCVTPDEWLETAHRYKLVDYGYINGIRLHLSFATMDAHLPEYALLRWEITEALNQIHWDINAELGNESFTTCQLANLGDLQQPASLLKGLYKGKTAILLAGGPSLDEALPWVRAHRDRLLVLAVSRISKRLLEVGVEPDFVFSVDPTDLSFDISREMLNFGPRTALVHAFHITPLLLGPWPHRAFYLGPMLPWKSPLNRKDNPGGPGPTVTNTALWCAGEFGCSTVILSGVDLCFTPSGQTHAQGSNEASAGPRLDLTALQVETNTGNMANTTPDFAAAARTLGVQAKLMNQRGIRLISSSANAVRVEHIDFVPLDALPIPEAATDAPAMLAGKIPPISAGQWHRQRQRIRQELVHALHASQKIKAMAEDALRLNEKFYRSTDRGEAIRTKSGMDRIEKTLNRDLKAFALLTKTLGIRKFLRIASPHESILEADFSVTEKMTQQYYEAYRDGAERLQVMLESALDQLDFRLDEETHPPEIRSLVAHWQARREPGRAKVWMSHHPEALAQLSTGELHALEACLTAFAAQLEKKDTAHARRARSHADLGASLKRANLLFKHRDIDGLQSMIGALNLHPEQEKAALYAAYVRGLVAELEQDLESALGHYLPIIEEGFQPLLEGTLHHVATCYLGLRHEEGARMALELLAALSPIYQPQLAELLRITGRTAEAIELCHAHLERFPEDRLTQIKLATLYAESGAGEAARLMLEHILRKEPGNSTVRALISQL